jgi:hypothetical protein
LFFPLGAVAWAGCTSQEVVVVKADGGPGAEGGTEEKDSGRVEQPPIGTVTDSGVSGQRLGDKGCKADEDCSSNLCVIAALEADNYCSTGCTKETAKTQCVKPLAGTCGRLLVCDPPP